MLQNLKLELCIVVAGMLTAQTRPPVLVVTCYPATQHRFIEIELARYHFETFLCVQVFINNLTLVFLFVLHHEKHPKRWIDVQRLGCSQMAKASSMPCNAIT